MTAPPAAPEPTGPKPTGKVTLFLVRGVIVVMVLYAVAGLGWTVVHRLQGG